ncbi:MAG: site-2 protease family protein [Clostridia bacterium]|nr:site-2 protease family protein [Clostridia bacterium]MBO5505049.1 site-2 protease family protein [Clostridia bacterium]
MADFFSGGMTGILSLLISVFCVLLSISIHEFAHGYMAYKLGDDTARVMGRLSVNPLHHLDPIGALCLLFFHFGWAKPVPVNPSKFTKVKIKTGMVLTAIAGPLANFILGFIAMILLRVVILYMADFAVSELLFIILYTLVIMNVGLGLFNLIPIPPLDGSKVLNALLPARIYFKIMQYERYGTLLLILFIWFGSGRFLSSLSGYVLDFYDFVLNLIPFLR